MTSQNTQTVFEIGIRSFPWATTAYPLFFVVIGVILIRFVRKGPAQVMGFLAVSAGILFFILKVTIAVPDFFTVRNEYASGKTTVTEGIVHDFHPAPASGLSIESFKIGETVFTYEAYSNSPCFHNAPIHAGPLREGQFARISFYRDCIQRVDIINGASAAGGPGLPSAK
jgi:hypothetical protein